MMEENRHSLNDFGAEMTQSVRTAGRVNQQKYTIEGYSSKMMRRSAHNNSYEEERYTGLGNPREENEGYPQTYLEIQTGFKKFKNSQIIALQQLRQEYEILKNLPIDDRLPSTRKVTDSMTSSVPPDDRSDATSRSKRKDHSSREIQLLALEKKQLEIVVGNSMKKIEELLHAEMEHKKQIHALKIEIEDKNVEEKYESIINNMRRTESEYQETINALRKDSERQKLAASQLNERIVRLEAQILSKELEIKRQFQERRRYDDTLRNEKDRFLTQEIDFKRLTMEYQMLEKEKASEIKSLIRDMDRRGSSPDQGGASRIRSMQDEMDLKDKRYQLLLEQLNLFQNEDSFKKGQDNSQIKGMFANFLSTQGLSNDSITRELRDRISQMSAENKRLNEEIHRQPKEVIIPHDDSNNQAFLETIRHLIDKVGQQPEKGQDQGLKKELEFLRTQVQGLKVNPETERKLQEYEYKVRQLETTIREEETTIRDLRSTVREIESTIHEFEKVIEDENIEKIRFMEDLKSVKQEYSQVFSSNETVTRRLGIAIQKEMQSKHEIQILKNELQALMSTRGDLTASQSENYSLKMRVQEMQRLQGQIDRLNEDLERLRNDLNVQKTVFLSKEEEYIDQIRILKRQNDEIDFEVSRAKKQGTLNVELLQRDHLSETSRYKMLAEQTREQNIAIQQELQEAMRIHAEKLRDAEGERSRLLPLHEQQMAEKNRQIELIRIQFEERISSKSTQMDNWRQPFEDRLRGKDSQLQEQRKQFDLLNGTIQSRHELEMMNMMKRIDILNEANDKFMKKNSWYVQLEGEIQELRRKLKYTKSINESVDHLWQVKEAEYGNVHEILKQLRNQ